VLELQVTDDVVFAHYRPSDAGPNAGGYVAQVWPGGAFLGCNFDRLKAMGTGQHAVDLDEECEEDLKGVEPEFDSEWRREFERFKFVLFMYGVGACVPLDVLSSARTVIRLESDDKTTKPDGSTVFDEGNR
jgi:hypothetical protein